MKKQWSIMYSMVLLKIWLFHQNIAPYHLKSAEKIHLIREYYDLNILMHKLQQNWLRWCLLFLTILT